MPVAGFVLTGGLSRRMGLDKATLAYRGRTLVESVAEEVLAAAESVTLVGHPERYQHFGMPVLGEEFAGCGPLSGIESALRHATTEWSLIVACDQPGLESGWLRDLVNTAIQHPASGVVVPVDSQSRTHPLCAVWNRGSHPVVREALEAGKYKLINVIAELRAFRLHVQWADKLRNVNTPEDWASVASR